MIRHDDKSIHARDRAGVLLDYFANGRQLGMWADVVIGPYEGCITGRWADVGIGPYEGCVTGTRADVVIGPYEGCVTGRWADVVIGPYDGAQYRFAVFHANGNEIGAWLAVVVASQAVFLSAFL